MEDIYVEYQETLAALTKDTRQINYRRDYADDIDWNERLIFIIGARGVGKTTMIFQRIKETHGTDSKALYITMDDVLLSSYKLVDIAKYHYNNDGTHLYVDEIHKYENWSRELKNINDKYKDLKVVVSGSSAMEIHKGKADLSRRAVIYEMPGFSLREYINVKTNQDLKSYALKELLDNHIEIAHEIVTKLKPLSLLRTYLKYGYYPFHLDGEESYHHKLLNVTNLILETDMPLTVKLSIHNAAKLRKLIYIISTQVPFQLNSTKLASTLGIDRATLNTYLQYLDKASILKLLWHPKKSYTSIAKPDKVYLQNTNLLYMINKSQINVGTLRETFFANQISHKHLINLAKSGDFLVDNKYTFEVGGQKKSYKQIAKVDHSYVVIDDVLVGVGNKIPMWMFGFLY